MEKYSAGYSYTNFNFVIQNIEEKLDTKNKYYPFICVLKNILQRDCPTKLSNYLTENIGVINLKEKKVLGLIDDKSPKWINTIKGDEKNQDYPAKVFFDEIIPKYFSKFNFIQQLILPEASINDIVGISNEDFLNQQVDFYLPQCKMVIEIDGIHHSEKVQRINDKRRDAYLLKHNIVTIRIEAKDLKEENDKFLEKINEIENILSKNYKRKLEVYDIAYRNINNHSKEEIKHFKVNAIIRFQILILSLLEKGILNLDDKCWNINILNRDINGFVKIAIKDLFIWFENLLALKNIEFKKPKINIIESRNEKKFFYKEDYINIDFSLYKRYTDENKLNKNIIYVRTDYYDGRRYFNVSSSNPIKYEIDKENNECIKSLEFLLKNIFGHDNFRSGQLPIIINSLQEEDTIGILPTGTGKSICYQLVLLLQPCISIVVCPIKSLMYDQKDNLKRNNIGNIDLITSDMSGEEKDIVLQSFSERKYQFIFISPERFQSKKFRESIDTLNRNSTIGRVVIDEVHCLSEWGHDFRTSYLNLVKTIKNFAPSAKLLGLTATASNFVLQDIKKEFDIENYNIKTIESFTRDELIFEVIKCSGNKRNILFDKLKELDSTKDIFKPNGENTSSGIIFTSTVNGDKGCYNISNEINRKFNIQTKYFSGEPPKNSDMTNEIYGKYKKQVQEEFKNNKLPLLVATKAFGMGVDKPNIRYTIHFNIPMSLEALYQEAGRAGRDKNTANCYILYEHEIIAKDILNKFFSIDTSIEELDKIQKSIINKKDILSNFYLWLLNNKGIEYEFKVILDIFNMYIINNKSSVTQLECKKLNYDLSEVQKALYRLSTIGIIEDWTIEIWSGKQSVLEVYISDFTLESMYESMANYIRKYDKEFDINIIKDKKLSKKDNKKTHLEMIKIFNDNNLDEYEKVIKLILIWTYDNIVYIKRQAIKTVSDLCNNFKSKEEFKMAIENNFKFDDDTFVLDNIAENPNNHKKWFEVFKNSKDEIDVVKINNIKFTLSRFLESYRYNTGLNFISGMIRLITNEYDDIDGKQRLESAFNQIKEYDDKTKNDILEFSLSVGKIIDPKNKIYLSKILCENYDDKLKIHENLNDEYSLRLIIKDMNKKLKNICKEIKCQKRKN